MQDQIEKETLEKAKTYLQEFATDYLNAEIINMKEKGSLIKDEIGNKYIVLDIFIPSPYKDFIDIKNNEKFSNPDQFGTISKEFCENFKLDFYVGYSFTDEETGLDCFCEEKIGEKEYIPFTIKLNITEASEFIEEFKKFKEYESNKLEYFKKVSIGFCSKLESNNIKLADIGIHVAKYLNGKDIRNIALTCKAASEEGKKISKYNFAENTSTYAELIKQRDNIINLSR